MTPRALLIWAIVALIAGLVVGLLLRRAVDSENAKEGSEKLGARIRRAARRRALDLVLRRWRNGDKKDDEKKG